MQTEIFKVMAEPSLTASRSETPITGEVPEVIRLRDLILQSQLDEMSKEACYNAVDELNKTFVRTYSCVTVEQEHGIMV
jgi:hypothetical protein